MIVKSSLVYWRKCVQAILFSSLTDKLKQTLVPERWHNILHISLLKRSIELLKCIICFFLFEIPGYYNLGVGCIICYKFLMYGRISEVFTTFQFESGSASVGEYLISWYPFDGKTKIRIEVLVQFVKWCSQHHEMIFR